MSPRRAALTVTGRRRYLEQLGQPRPARRRRTHPRQHPADHHRPADGPRRRRLRRRGLPARGGVRCGTRLTNRTRSLPGRLRARSESNGPRGTEGRRSPLNGMEARSTLHGSVPGAGRRASAANVGERRREDTARSHHPRNPISPHFHADIPITPLDGGYAHLPAQPEASRTSRNAMIPRNKST